MTTKERNEQYIIRENIKAVKAKRAFYDNAIAELKQKTKNVHGQYLTEQMLNERCDGSLEYYHLTLINETLKAIRRGRVGYVYNLKQAEDIIRFEPDSIFFWNDKLQALSVCLPA